MLVIQVILLTTRCYNRTKTNDHLCILDEVQKLATTAQAALLQWINYSFSIEPLCLANFYM